MLDVNKIRDQIISLHGLTKADFPYTIYYDETNNIRRLHVRSDGLNVPKPKCFVIGGIAHAGPARTFKLDDLRSDLRIQQNVREIKLKNLAAGDFLNILKTPELEIFLKWLCD